MAVICLLNCFSDMWNVFKVVTFIYFLISSYAWFGTLLPQHYMPPLICALMLICTAVGNFHLQFTQRAYALGGVLLLFVAYTTLTVNIQQGGVVFFSLLPALILYVLNKEHQKNLLRFLTNALGILLIFSVVYYGLGFVVNLPHGSFKVPNNDFYPTFDNYYLFLKSDLYMSQKADTNRFAAFFLEPGHLSMICCLVMFANRFQFKKYPILWIYLVCVAISFSLVGYIIFFVAFALLRIRNIATMMATVVLVAGSWLFFTEIWQNGDNPVNVLIFERMKLDESKGIKGNNRTTKQTDYFFRQCVKDGTILTGIGNNDNMGQKVMGAGYKIYMLRYGIFAAMFAALYYLMLINPRANKRYAYSFFCVIALLFLQRAYPLWFAWLSTYTLGIGIMRNESFFTPWQIENHRRKLLKKMRRRMTLPGTASEASDAPIENSPADARPAGV